MVNNLTGKRESLSKIANNIMTKRGELSLSCLTLEEGVRGGWTVLCTGGDVSLHWLTIGRVGGGGGGVVRICL